MNIPLNGRLRKGEEREHLHVNDVDINISSSLVVGILAIQTFEGRICGGDEVHGDDNKRPLKESPMVHVLSMVSSLFIVVVVLSNRSLMSLTQDDPFLVVRWSFRED